MKTKHILKSILKKKEFLIALLITVAVCCAMFILPALTNNKALLGIAYLVCSLIAVNSVKMLSEYTLNAIKNENESTGNKR